MISFGYKMYAAVLAFAVSLCLAGTVATADETEKERLRKCEIDICRMIVEKKKEGDDLACDLSKTWAKEDIAEEAKEKKLPWELGDARCAVKLNVSRNDIVSAVTDAAYTLKVPEQGVDCEVEQGGTKHPIKLTLAPQIKFKNGEAVEASLGVGNIEAPAVVKGVIWSAAKMEEFFGIFHSDLLKEINSFVSKKCPKRLAAN